MEKNEKIHSEIEARFRQMNQSFRELARKADQQKEKYEGFQRQQLDAMEEKFRKADRKLKTLNETGDGERWQKEVNELKHFMSDIDDDLRKALVYFA